MKVFATSNLLRRKKVISSNLAAVGYAVKRQILHVRFKSGSIYEYTGVPKSEYQNLMNAVSHGKYFYHNIRMKYPYVRIK